MNNEVKDFKFSILAIVDGVLNNEGLKQNKLNDASDSWNQLLIDLELCEKKKNYIYILRQRWALGASVWLSGKNNSLQNLKNMFGYTDDEWQFVWSTMSKRGAWNVPNIKDSMGTVIKENYGPEMMIRYIAHDLRCNIIVIDLKRDNLQFCSGNYLKSDNVVFDCPLLLYATGNHFQSILPTNYSRIIRIAEEFQSESIGNAYVVPSVTVPPTIVDQRQSELLKSHDKEIPSENLSLEQLKHIRNKTASQKIAL